MKRLNKKLQLVDEKLSIVRSELDELEETSVVKKYLKLKDIEQKLVYDRDIIDRKLIDSKKDSCDHVWVNVNDDDYMNIDCFDTLRCVKCGLKTYRRGYNVNLKMDYELAVDLFNKLKEDNQELTEEELTENFYGLITTNTEDNKLVLK